MEVIKRKDAVILRTPVGEYHFSLKEYENLGEKEAIRIASVEIRKKSRLATFDKKEINFGGARDLGFCEYGIRDWCEKLSIDVDKTYTIKNLKGKLTLEAFLEYPLECRKLFGDNVLDVLGGVEIVLEGNENADLLEYILNNNYLNDENMRLLACQFAEECFHLFEKEYPDDKRPRLAIEAARKYALDPSGGNRAASYAASYAASSAASSAASYAASYAASSAARSAASYAASYAASSAARSAASSAASYAVSYAASYAASSAAHSAAHSAARRKQSNQILTLILMEGEAMK